MPTFKPKKVSKVTSKVFVGLSGGVDSAVSAALLKRAGYDVVGVFIRIVLPGYPCTAVADRQDAMRVAAHLRIPFHEIDLSEKYQEKVFAHMLEEFAEGRTPNPDTLCNREIKFGLFFDYAMQAGADFVATGHYVQVVAQPKIEMHISADTEKDQSYFLWMVEERRLSRTLFPVGDKRKSEVRKLAQKFGLPNATRKDSQGLCFLGDISIQDMLARELHPAAGVVLDEAGESIGTHAGVELYTLGQRHGFSVRGESGQTNQPLFVIAKDRTHNTITVSKYAFPQHATRTEIFLTETNWIGEARSGAYQARYRYRQKVMHATLDKEYTPVRVLLHEPRFVPEGQSLVLYDGQRCVGGGIVHSSKLL